MQPVDKHNPRGTNADGGITVSLADTLTGVDMEGTNLNEA